MIEKALKILYRYDAHDDLYWIEREGEVRIFIQCNDIFFWGTADLEEIKTDDDLKLLDKCYADAGAAADYGEAHGGELYCARRRKMRPQGAAYKSVIDPALWPLFDACGPKRPAAFGNPVDRDDLKTVSLKKTQNS